VIPVLTADEMRRADRRTIDEIGLPGPVLMENAGAGLPLGSTKIPAMSDAVTS